MKVFVGEVSQLDNGRCPLCRSCRQRCPGHPLPGTKGYSLEAL